MRNLTIKRDKSFVGFLGVMKIYIEDHISGEININNIPCRKIGTLKNGEEKTFQIGLEETRVFVIADRLSRNYSNDCYVIPAGYEDVALSGRNRYNLSNGHAFRFDNNESPEALLNRKRGTRKGRIIIIIAAIIGVLIGVLEGILSDIDGPLQARTFYSDGVSITLTNKFIKTDSDDYIACYGSEEIAVLISNEEFSTAEELENYSIEEYGDLVIEASDLTSSEIKVEDGLTYFEYDSENLDSKEIYHFCAYVYKTDTAFWLVQFSAFNDDFVQYAEQITEWAKSVDFS